MIYTVQIDKPEDIDFELDKMIVRSLLVSPYSRNIRIL